MEPEDQTLTGFLFAVSCVRYEESVTDGVTIYLRNRAAARFLEYALEDFGVTTSDNVCLGGSDLTRLAKAIDALVTSVEQRPDSWPISLGCRMSPSGEIGQEIVRPVSNSEVLTFLRDVAGEVQIAIQSGKLISWAGGE